MLSVISKSFSLCNRRRRTALSVSCPVRALSVSCPCTVRVLSVPVCCPDSVRIICPVSVCPLSVCPAGQGQDRAARTFAVLVRRRLLCNRTYEFGVYAISENKTSHTASHQSVLTYRSNKCKKLITAITRSCFRAASMLVTEVGNSFYLWQVWDVGDGFGNFGHQHSLSLYFSAAKRATTFKRGHSHRDSVTNINKSSPTLSYQHHCPWSIQGSLINLGDGRGSQLLLVTDFSYRKSHQYNE